MSNTYDMLRIQSTLKPFYIILENLSQILLIIAIYLLNLMGCVKFILKEFQKKLKLF